MGPGKQGAEATRTIGAQGDKVRTLELGSNNNRSDKVPVRDNIPVKSVEPNSLKYWRDHQLTGTS